MDRLFITNSKKEPALIVKIDPNALGDYSPELKLEFPFAFRLYYFIEKTDSIESARCHFEKIFENSGLDENIKYSNGDIFYLNSNDCDNNVVIAKPRQGQDGGVIK